MNWALEEMELVGTSGTDVGFYGFCSSMASQRDWVMSTPHHRRVRRFISVCVCVHVSVFAAFLPLILR